MKKFLLCFMLFTITKASIAQTIDFENLTFPIGKNYWKGNTGVPGVTSFQSGNFNFRNQNDTSSFGDYWSGWAYSKLKDTTSIAYDTNDCAAFHPITSNNNTYVVAYQSFSDLNNHIIINKIPTSPSFLSGLYVTNSTIAFRSMQNGDFAAKKFGGATGNDPDFFKIRFFGWYNGNGINDTVDFYLADLRDTNNTNDYIIKDWTYVNMVKLATADSISYILESSDNGGFGMNTPAYFCLDNIIMVPVSVSELTQNSFLKIYPNPIHNDFEIQNTANEKCIYTIFNLNGKIIAQHELKGNEIIHVNSSTWSKGIYAIKIEKNNQVYYQKIVK